MTGTTGEGWLFSLAYDEKSNWGTVSSFDSDLESDPPENGRIIVRSAVWGTLQSLQVLPEPGDGFAFYHSSRALFPDNDPFRRKPRISAIGELLAIELDGRNVERIEVAIDPELLGGLKERPIVRDGSARPLFEQCGIIPGAVATLYRAPAPTWKRIVSLLPKRSRR